MPPRIFHVDLDAFFVSVERRFNPSLEGKPVVVGGRPNDRGVVACASYEARRFGLHAGMPLRSAYRLCPQAVYLPGQYARYEEASHQFMDILRQFTPFVESLGLDEAYLDMTGFESLYGPPAEAARAMKERIRSDVGITASVGIASSKATAKVASDYDKPDGLVEVPPGEDAAFLAPLDVDRLPGVGGKVAAALRTLGVRTVGDLAALPGTTLRRVFGAWGDLLHRLALGQDHTPVAWEPPPPKSIGRSTTFDRDTGDPQFILDMLRYLTERVMAELRRQGMEAQHVVATVRYADFITVGRHRTLPAPTNRDDVVFSAAAELARQAMGERSLPVRLVGVSVSPLSKQSGQLRLLGDAAPRDAHLGPALDRVREKYGFTAIQTGRTFRLRGAFPSDRRGYVLKTPSLSR